MKLNKYSEVKQNSGLTIGSYSAKKSTSSSSGSSSNNKSVGLDRTIWGQEDDGDDLDGDLTCGGNIYIIDNYDENEDDEEEDIEGYSNKLKQEPITPLSVTEDLKDKFDNDEGGNLYVKRQLVVDKNIKTPEIYSKTIYLDYPELKEDNSNKTNLLDILKDHKKLTIKDSKNNELGTFDNSEDKTITIKNYDDEISSLNSRVGTNETNISNLQTTINNLGGRVDNVESDISVLAKSKSVILATVELERVFLSSDNIDFITFNNSTYDGITFKKYLVGEGTIDLYFDIDTDKISYIYSIYANATIGSTIDNSDSDSEILNGMSSSKSCDGAYGGMWSHTRAVLSNDRKTLVVRARIWHKDKGDNESVDSNKGWSVGAISKISYIVAGSVTLV